MTGGAGFIGSHLVEALLERGQPVRVLDDLSTGHRSNIEPFLDRIEFIQGSAADPDAVAEAVVGVDAIFHEGAIPSVPRSVEKPLESHISGPTATLTLLEAARQAGVRRFIFAASSSAYGDSAELPKHEGMLPCPLSPYAVGKLAGEYYASAYAHLHGIDTASLRYFNIFGPRQDPSSTYSGVISRFISVMGSGERPTIFGDGKQTRDFTYVANVVRANLLALDSPKPLRGAVLNVGTGERISLLDLVTALNKLLGLDLEPDFRPERAGDVRDSQACLSRIRDVLGYQPTVSFAEGLRRTLAAELPNRQISA